MKMSRSLLTFLGLLLTFFIFGSSAHCINGTNCDCNVENINTCSCVGRTGGLFCGSEVCINPNLYNEIYQCSGTDDICHFGPCTNGCAIKFPDSLCKN